MSPLHNNIASLQSKDRLSWIFPQDSDATRNGHFYENPNVGRKVLRRISKIETNKVLMNLPVEVNGETGGSLLPQLTNVSKIMSLKPTSVLTTPGLTTTLSC
jgi:hypothetical protein